jgi:hypothetical protein
MSVGPPEKNKNAVRQSTQSMNMHCYLLIRFFLIVVAVTLGITGEAPGLTVLLGSWIFDGGNRIFLFSSPTISVNDFDYS